MTAPRIPRHRPSILAAVLPHWRRPLTALKIALLLLLASSAGCGSVPTPPPQPLVCDVPTAALDPQPCAAPITLAPGATFGDLLQAAAQDRSALRLCTARALLLAETLRRCADAAHNYTAATRGPH